MPTFRTLFPALAAAFLGAAGAQADPVTFDTARGEMTLPEVPERIVVLDIAALDSITALGVMPAGVIAPLYVDYLPEALEDATRVGSFFEPDFEAIAALAPDVIVVGARASTQVDALSRIAPVADMSIGTEVLAEGKARLHGFGAMLAREDKAAELAAALDDRLVALRPRVADQGGRALIIMTNGPKLSTFGANSRFGWLHRTLGFDMAVDDVDAGNHGDAVSFEFIAEADPDTLLIIDRGAAIGGGTEAAEATLDNPLVAGTRAARNGKVIYLAPAELYIASGGIQSLNRTLDELTAALGAE
ncbi:siderophore ABC transporter substrate-binding protein [Pseudooceanicola aestuarii]|uniref:siderophore ABC transporter substrate-binding protein n=1 Tax=Pseudooceanicola aestuarii TaxID=2697319 RepID=UPI0013D1A039|nr:siderophore ABC transporter substrate-binding protein [Pseudooceanicola aestuarii]